MSDLMKKAEEYATGPIELRSFLTGAREALGMASGLLRDTNVALAATHLLHSSETTPEQDKAFEALGALLNEAADEIDGLLPPTK